MRSNVSRETIWCLRTDVSRETFGSFAVSSGSPRAARSRCPLFRGMRGRDSRAEREARGTGRQSAGRAGLAGGARGARGGRASRRVRREWARFSIGLTTGWQAGWQRHAEATRAGARATRRRAYANTGSTLHPASTRPIISREAIGRLRANVSREASWPRAGAARRKIARGDQARGCGAPEGLTGTQAP